MSLLGLMMAMLFCFTAPAQAFVAYDKKAQEMPAGVERGMLDGAEDEAKSAKEVPAILSNYPSLTEARQNKRYNFWRSLCKKEAGMDEEVADSVPERGQEGEWQSLSTEANRLPKFF
jgi:hypothetical protein